MFTITSLKKLKNVLYLFICLLFIIPGFNHAKCLTTISQTAPASEEEKKFLLNELYKKQETFNRCAKSYRKAYEKIVSTQGPYDLLSISELNHWRNNICSTCKKYTSLFNNIYISAYFLATVYYQKDFGGFPNTQWFDDLINIAYISVYFNEQENGPIEVNIVKTQLIGGEVRYVFEEFYI